METQESSLVSKAELRKLARLMNCKYQMETAIRNAESLPTEYMQVGDTYIYVMTFGGDYKIKIG
ncbi:MAG TPA: hypothetical protein VIY48_11030 [Candidatus Paceibacterota bacterium]